jgi:hypothetical protein
MRGIWLLPAIAMSLNLINSPAAAQNFIVVLSERVDDALRPAAGFLLIVTSGCRPRWSISMVEPELSLGLVQVAGLPGHGQVHCRRHLRQLFLLTRTPSNCLTRTMRLSKSMGEE